MAYGFGRLWLIALVAYGLSLRSRLSRLSRFGRAYRASVAYRAYREDAITMDAIRRVVIVITVA
jgi:hypothetical protein